MQRPRSNRKYPIRMLIVLAGMMPWVAQAQPPPSWTLIPPGDHTVESFDGANTSDVNVTTFLGVEMFPNLCPMATCPSFAVVLIERDSQRAVVGSIGGLAVECARSVYGGRRGGAPVESHPADSGNLGFYLSEDSNIDTDDQSTTYTCGIIEDLAPGQMVTCDAGMLPLISLILPGSYYFGAIVDDLDRTEESDETNNARAADTGPITLSEKCVVDVDLSHTPPIEFPFPSIGNIAILTTLTTPEGGLACLGSAGVDTGGSGATVEELEDIVKESGILQSGFR